MYRRLALAGLLAATSTQAYALGLGPIKLHSGLNQPLDADVELLTETPHALNQLQVSLAPNAAFQQAGVRRTLLLTHLKFKVVKQPGGRAYIHISSPMPIREPFLDFVLEVDWSGGQLMREYTMLINPPTFMAHATPPASTPTPSRTVQPATPSAASSTAAPTAPTMAQAAAAAGDQARAGQYGPTARTDTLWTIAAKVRPDHHVTMEQTMVALQRANPQAFYGGNINRLKAGYILRVPDRAAMTSLAPLSAQQVVARQNAIWREVRKSGGVERQASTQTAATASQGGRLKLVAPRQPSAGAASGAVAGGNGAATAGGAQAGAGGGIASLRKQLDAQRSETAQLQAQVSKLQAQIQSMHHLLNVHNGSMAQVQGQSAATAGATAGTVGSATKAASSAAAQPGKSPAGLQSQKAASTPKSQGTAKPKIQTAAKAPKPAVPPVPPVAKHEPPPVQAAPTPPAPQPTIWDELLAHPMMDGLGGAAILVALLLGWVSSRRRRMAMTEFQESILAAEQAGNGPAAAARSVAAEGSDADEGSEGAAAESSLLSDFAVSDMDAIQSESEADPLAEADVYLAYGRYQQAEELVSEAIKEAPDRNDLHMKLLEIFHAAQNVTAFDSEAESFLARLDGQDDPLWGQVVEMGREISPENPLYREGAADEETDSATPAVTADAADSDESDSSDSHELEAPELMVDEPGSAAADPEIGDDAEAPAAETPLDNGLDFDLDFDLGDSVPEPSADAEVDSSDIEFSLGDEEPSAAINPESAQFPDIDFESDSDAAADGFEMPDLSVDAVGTEGDTGATGETTTSDEPMSADSVALDGMEFDLDLSSLPELDDDNEQTSGEADEGEGLLADVDEVGTKLDLARAYMDMGDPDGARSILEEVRQEGNGDQQEEAQSLLSQLA